MRLDVNSFLGAYPFRRVPGTSADALLKAMDRTGVDEAWVSHLPSVFWRDPAAGNSWLYDTARRFDRLRPVPAVHPGLSGWEQLVREARLAGAPAVRCDPPYYALDATGPELRALVHQCGEERVPLLMAVRLEDARQRHPNDRAGELPPWAVRTLIRMHPAVRFIVTHAERSFVEEVHFGSTPDEATRVWWDISWLWGPPEDHLQTLVRTIGASRFVFGTGQPLRLPEAAVAKLDLLDLTVEERAAIESENVAAIAPSSGARPMSPGPRVAT
jgi:predicted TIM-barrel fold metal-dependent hydrolase